MYSEKIKKKLESKKIGIGDRIVVKKGKKGAEKQAEGLLMPQTGAGDPGTLVLKLDSGYNIGIRYEKGTEISKSRHKEPKAIKEEEEYELGKSRKPMKLEFLPDRPAISLISVGGTISSRVDYKTGGVTALSRPSDILYNVPELKYIVNIKNMLKPFNIMSESMNHEHWQNLARKCALELNKKDIRGVIITHGTDTLHFTSAALSFFLRELNKPVVLTGSQRSTDRGSSDGGMNLVCSSFAALSDIAEVGICMHSSINDKSCIFSRGTKVRKMDTQRRDAFRPINEYPLALIWPEGKIKVKNRNYIERDEKKRVKVDDKFEPMIALLQSYPGSDPSVMAYLVKKGYMGFVIQATGLGQLPSVTNSWLPVIKRTVGSGIPVYLAPETLYGRLNLNVYSEGRAVLETGAVPLGDMLPETAYVKLGWVLGHFIEHEEKNRKKGKGRRKQKPMELDMDKVNEMMLTNYAGEITKRTMAGAFLY